MNGTVLSANAITRMEYNCQSHSTQQSVVSSSYSTSVSAVT